MEITFGDEDAVGPEPSVQAQGQQAARVAGSAGLNKSSSSSSDLSSKAGGDGSSNAGSAAGMEGCTETAWVGAMDEYETYAALAAMECGQEASGKGGSAGKAGEAEGEALAADVALLEARTSLAGSSEAEASAWQVEEWEKALMAEVMAEREAWEKEQGSRPAQGEQLGELHAAAAAKVDHGAGSFDWHSQFQQILDQPALSADEIRMREKQVAALRGDFVNAAQRAVQQVVAMWYADKSSDDNDANAPVALVLPDGSVSKDTFVGGNMLLRVVGNDANAMKLAGQELRAQQAWLNARVGSLNFPLQAVLTYAGVRVLVSSIAPLDVASSTLAYGSDGKRVLSGTSESNSGSSDSETAAAIGGASLVGLQMDKMGRKLNLEAHTVANTGVRVATAAGVQGHVDAQDGRVTVLNTAASMPSAVPRFNSPVAHAVQRLRPEFVSTHHSVLNSDALSGWAGDDEAAEASNVAVAAATQELATSTIPKLAAALDSVYGGEGSTPVALNTREMDAERAAARAQPSSKKASISVHKPVKASTLGKRKEGDTRLPVVQQSQEEAAEASKDEAWTDASSVPLSLTAHEHGVNLRYLGLVRAHVTTPWLRALILLEMSARAIKQGLWTALRSQAAATNSFVLADQQALVAHTLNQVWANTGGFWSALQTSSSGSSGVLPPLKQLLLRSFDSSALAQAEWEAEVDVRTLMSEADNETWPLKEQLLQRVSELAGFSVRGDLASSLGQVGWLEDVAEGDDTLAVTGDDVTLLVVNKEVRVVSRSQALLASDRYAEAIELLEAELAARQAARGGDEDRSMLFVMTSLAQAHAHEGHVEKAASLYGKAIATMTAQRQEGDSQTLAILFRNLGSMYSSARETDAALRTYREGLEVLQVVKGGDSSGSSGGSGDNDAFAAQDPTQVSIVALQLLSLMGSVYAARKDYARAESTFGDALAAMRTRAKALLDNPQALNKPARQSTLTAIGSCYLEFASMLLQKRDLEMAQHMYERAMDVLRLSVGTRSITYAAALNEYGLLLFARRRVMPAVATIRDALSTVLDVSGETNLQAAASMENLATVLMALMQMEEAEQLLLRSLAIKEALFGDHDRTIDAHLFLAQVYTEQGLTGRAVQHLEIADAVYARLYGDSTRLIQAKLFTQKATTAAAQRNFDEALSNMVMAVEVRDTLLPQYASEKLDGLLLLAQYGQFMGDLSVTLAYVHRALEVVKHNLNLPGKYYTSVLDNLSRLYYATGDSQGKTGLLDGEVMYWRAVLAKSKQAWQRAAQGVQVSSSETQTEDDDDAAAAEAFAEANDVPVLTDKQDVVKALQMMVHVLDTQFLESGANDMAQLLSICDVYKQIRELDEMQFEAEAKTQLLRKRVSYARTMKQAGRLEEALVPLDETVSEYCTREAFLEQGEVHAGLLQDTLDLWSTIHYAQAGEDTVTKMKAVQQELVLRREMLRMEPLTDEQLESLESTDTSLHLEGCDGYYAKCLVNMAAMYEENGSADKCLRMGELSLECYQLPHVRETTPIQWLVTAFVNHAGFLADHGDANGAWPVIKKGMEYARSLSSQHPSRQSCEELFRTVRASQTVEAVEEEEGVEEVYGYGEAGMGGGNPFSGMGGVQMMGGLGGTQAISLEQLGAQMFPQQLEMMHSFGLTDDANNVKMLLMCNGDVEVAVQMMFGG